MGSLLTTEGKRLLAERGEREFLLVQRYPTFVLIDTAVSTGARGSTLHFEVAHTEDCPGDCKAVLPCREVIAQSVLDEGRDILWHITSSHLIPGDSLDFEIP